MKYLLKDMTPIEWVGAAYIGLLFIGIVISFSFFVYSVITGEADLSNASYGFAESTWMN